MTESTWHFRAKIPGYAARDPISSEFFANESVQNVARALIREAIQNSLDARGGLAGTEPVRIRVVLGVDADAALKNDAEAFFTGVWPHLSAPRNKLQNAPKRTDRC